MVSSNVGNLIVCGPNTLRINLEGRTIGFIKRNFRDILGITKHCMPTISGNLVSDDYVVNDKNLDLVFSRRAGSRSR